MIVFNCSLEQPSGAGQAAALMTDRRQSNPVGGGHIPDAFVFSAIETTQTFRGFQRNPKAPSSCHLWFDALWVIEAAIFTVRRFSRFAAAEMS
jgi:hypothetical protein